MESVGIAFDGVTGLLLWEDGVNLTKIFAAVALVALPVATYGSGCSSSSTKNSGDGGGSSSSSSGSSSGGTSGSSSSGSSSSGSGSGGVACTPACPTQCTRELCAIPQASIAAGDPCDVCTSAVLTGVCNASVLAACSNDPDCVALLVDCLDGCDTKADGGVPTDDAGADQACFGSDAGAVGCSDCCVTAHTHGAATIETALIACACCH